MFSVRLVSADSYQARPLPQLDPAFSEFRGSEIKHVPVVRVFGITPNGEKACLHIHGVFPYLYVPYTGEEDPSSLAYRLAASLDAAINVSLGSATSNTQHVYLIQRVSGIPFYGYHKKQHQYLKIYFYNPAMIKRAADLLQNGSVLNQSLQPHEAHIPYILQFMMDYNVYGMSLINMSGVKHRRETQSLAELVNSGQSATSENSEIDYLPATVERQSTCKLEIDALASDIINRREIESGLELNPGLAAIWEEERARRVQAGFQGGDSQLVNPKSPPRPTFQPTDNDFYQEQRLARRLLMISQCDESTLSTTTNQSVAYAAEVRDDENLLNSSSISIPAIQKNHLPSRDDTIDNMSFLDSPTFAESPKLSQDCSILGTDDMTLVDMLAQLAGGDSVEKPEAVDTDSVLGSQVSIFFNEEKSDNEDEDISDLNLTCLQLDSLSGCENPENSVGRRNELSNFPQDESSLSTVHLSPFLTPQEALTITSGVRDSENTERGTDDTENHQIPQYDGAGDSSPTYLDSPSSMDGGNDEDIERPTDDFNRFPTYNGTFKVASQSRESEDPEETSKKSCRSSDISVRNSPSDSPSVFEKEMCNKSSRGSYDSRNVESTEECIAAAAHTSALTSDAYLDQYSAGYGFERFPEIGSDFVPDLEEMHSSMEIEILLSCEDSDSPGAIGQEADNEAIPLDAVLNGDPCFTESAEQDKSDVTELRDQYVSLLGNSLLPDVHTNPIEGDFGSVSSSSDSDYQRNEKTRRIPMNSVNHLSAAASRDSSSCSENVTPNIQEPELRIAANRKINANEAQEDYKEHARTANDNPDLNCNVVDTWAELQNVQDDKRLNRLKNIKTGQRIPGARQNRRKADRSLPNITSQLFGRRPDNVLPQGNISTEIQHKSLRKIPLRSASKSQVKKPKDLTPTASFVAAECTPTAPKETAAKLFIVEAMEEKLSTRPLLNVPRVPESGKIHEEDDDKLGCKPIQTTPSLGAFHRSMNGPDNPSLAKTVTTFSHRVHSPEAFSETESIVEPVTPVFEELADNGTEEIDELPAPIIEKSQGASYYCPEKSEKNRSTVIEHRHCNWSMRRNQIIRDRLFSADQLYLISFRGTKAPATKKECNRPSCKIPIVYLDKIEYKTDATTVEIVETPKITERSSSDDLPSATTDEAQNSPVLEAATRPASIESTNDFECLPKRKPRGRRKRDVSPMSPAESSVSGDSSEWSKNSSSDDGSSGDESSDRAESRSLSIVRQTSSKSNNHQRRKITKSKESFVKKNSKKQHQVEQSKVANIPKQDDKLPGIPGVLVIPRKRGRPKKIVLPTDNANIDEGRIGIELPKEKKALCSPLFPKRGAQCEISESPPSITVSTNLASDLSKSASTDERKDRTAKRSFLSVSPPQENPNSREISEDIPPSPEKPSAMMRYLNDIKTCSAERKALLTMIRETKCRNTKAKLNLLLKLRQSTLKELKAKVKKCRSSSCNEEKRNDTKAATPKSAKNNFIQRTATEFQKVEEPSPTSKRDRIELSGSTKFVITQRKEENTGNSGEDDRNSTVAVSETSVPVKNGECQPVLEDSTGEIEIHDAIRNENCGAVINPVLDSLVSDFETPGLSVSFGTSVDDAARYLFATETEIQENVIVETDNREDLSEDSRQHCYRIDRYPINETNFFTVNNYSIDAVSLEIPTCLFEEDSNSVEHRLPRREMDENLQNFENSPSNADETSNISMDPRDMDVYDAESLTSANGSLLQIIRDDVDSPLGAPELSETIAVEFFVIETPIDAQRLNDAGHSCSGKTREGQARPSHREYGALDETLSEEDSPEFEALSPRPIIFQIPSNTFQQHFNVHSLESFIESGKSLENNAEDNSMRDENRTGRSAGGGAEYTKLDDEIIDLVSRVVMGYGNHPNAVPTDTTKDRRTNNTDEDDMITASDKKNLHTDHSNGEEYNLNEEQGRTEFEQSGNDSETLVIVLSEPNLPEYNSNKGEVAPSNEKESEEAANSPHETTQQPESIVSTVAQENDEVLTTVNGTELTEGETVSESSTTETVTSAFVGENEDATVDTEKQLGTGPDDVRSPLLLKTEDSKASIITEENKNVEVTHIENELSTTAEISHPTTTNEANPLRSEGYQEPLPVATRGTKQRRTVRKDYELAATLETEANLSLPTNAQEDSEAVVIYRIIETALQQNESASELMIEQPENRKLEIEENEVQWYYTLRNEADDVAKVAQIDKNMNDAGVTDAETEQLESKNDARLLNISKETPSVIAEDSVSEDSSSLGSQSRSVIGELESSPESNENNEFTTTESRHDVCQSPKLRKSDEAEQTSTGVIPSLRGAPQKMIKSPMTRKRSTRSQPTRKCVEKMKSELKSQQNRDNCERSIPELESQEILVIETDPKSVDAEREIYSDAGLDVGIKQYSPVSDTARNKNTHYKEERIVICQEENLLRGIETLTPIISTKCAEPIAAENEIAIKNNCNRFPQFNAEISDSEFAPSQDESCSPIISQRRRRKQRVLNEKNSEFISFQENNGDDGREKPAEPQETRRRRPRRILINNATNPEQGEDKNELIKPKNSKRLTRHIPAIDLTNLCPEYPSSQDDESVDESIASKQSIERRGRGRPRRSSLLITQESLSQVTSLLEGQKEILIKGVVKSSDQSKRKRGRPRKSVTIRYQPHSEIGSNPDENFLGITEKTSQESSQSSKRRINTEVQKPSRQLRRPTLAKQSAAIITSEIRPSQGKCLPDVVVSASPESQESSQESVDDFETKISANLKTQRHRRRRLSASTEWSFSDDSRERIENTGRELNSPPSKLSFGKIIDENIEPNRPIGCVGRIRQRTNRMSKVRSTLTTPSQEKRKRRSLDAQIMKTEYDFSIPKNIEEESVQEVPESELESATSSPQKSSDRNTLSDSGQSSVERSSPFNPNKRVRRYFETVVKHSPRRRINLSLKRREPDIPTSVKMLTRDDGRESDHISVISAAVSTPTKIRASTQSSSTKEMHRSNKFNVSSIDSRYWKEPRIVLERLSQDLLKAYGITNKYRIEKPLKNFKKTRSQEDFRVPAYDGAADLSSSDSGDDPDVTIAREEKRVCVYQSGKKAATPRRESIVTPKKRKLDVDASVAGPSSKRRTVVKDVTKNSPYRSPSRTSMLKSPGRLSGYYPPLPIIITSPKVRKETDEPCENVSSENRDDSSGVCHTPKGKRDRLRETMMRGRINPPKLSDSKLGEKHDLAATNVPEQPGELDGIASSESKECGTIEADATRIRDAKTTPKDTKDARKKLVFSVAEKIDRPGTSNDSVEEPDNKASRNSRSENLESSVNTTTNDTRASNTVLETLINPKLTMSPSQDRPSQPDGSPDLKIRDPYEVTTDEDSGDEDGICNVTFSQYVDSQTNKQQALLDQNKINAELIDEPVVLRPKFNPPTRQDVIDTMEGYGIPSHRNQEPFFSIDGDVPKQKELAHRMLKVPGKSLKDVPAFVSSVEGVTGISRLRKMKVKEFNPSLARSKDIDMKILLSRNERIILTPLVQPPTQKEVRDWQRAREYLAKKKKHEEEESRRKKNDEEAKIKLITVAKEDEDECTPNTLDLSVVGTSSGISDTKNEQEKTLSRALSLKLAKKSLVKKAEDLATSRLRHGSEERMEIDSQNAEGTEDSRRGSGDSNSSEMDRTLLSVLGKSRLFREQEASKHLGVSCGQIEFLSDSTRSNVANENLQNAKALTRYQYLTIMCLEVHVTTRGDLLPDAQHDPIAAIFFSVQSDVPPTSSIKPLEHGVIVLADSDKAKNRMYYSYASNVPWSIAFADNEEALLNLLVNLITRVDPEILIGWELETLSWGYVFQRASTLGMNLYKRISRIPATQGKWEAQPRDIETLAEVKLPGRIVLDIWRLMRHEAALLSYTFESMMHQVLNERISCPSFGTLTSWWSMEKPRPSRWRVVEHYSIRILGVFRILDQLDIIGRTSELARLFGIQFFEVFSRGSQYRVESVMLRLAKPLNYIPVSPSSQQRASMRAMEALPLIMEPESMFYSDPLIVLDFQSLYPSIIIAHNYCFSTCLGRIEHIGQPQPFEFGAYTLRVTKSTSLKLQGKVNYAPCGVAFVKPEVCLGVLPRMLTEILETRFMVKKAMKDHNKDDKTLQRALHSRQMGLKFLANVTYGYTAANFSGRMPCIEVGDSVVSKSKETLERAIKLVESTPRWGARVVYGDTDSLFILVPGKSKADAFVIGNEIADAVTDSNPPPIKLKFEKVLYPAILQTKKRYCGYMYETPEQEEPTYLAKGIETVRRDGCPAVSKILEKTLKILFETKDVSLVKKYVTRQLDKVLRGKVSIQDLTFAKEFRGMKGYKAKACVPALELTKRLMKKDPRAVPRNNERVRYVIVAGAPNQALIHCVRTPRELINDPGLRPNAIYYVTRVIIPPLNRCLNLMGVNVNDWYKEMPHRHILDNPVGQPGDKQKLTIFQYFGTIVCAVCGQSSHKGICADCLANSADALVVIYEKLRRLDRTNSNITAICQSCVGQTDDADCASLDCPVFYRRAQAQRELSQAAHLHSIIECGNNLEL